MKDLISSPLLYPLWRIGWVEQAFFKVCRWLDAGRLARELWDFNLFGFDISYYQGIVNFVKILAYGTKFLILRAGYALTQDIKFSTYISAVEGIPLSVYHFYDPVVDPIQQANKLISIITPYKSKIHRVWLDFEFWWSGSYSSPTNWKKYRDTIRAAGFKTGIYTRATWWDSRVGTLAADFATDPCWAAQYSSSLTLIPKGWTKAMIWQKGTPAIGIEAGVQSQEIDLDIWNTDYDFTAEWGVILPPTGETMKYKVIWAEGVRKRTAPTTSNSYTSIVLPVNTISEVVQDNISDATYPSDPNRKWVQFADGYYGASNYPDGTGPQTRMVKVEDAPTIVLKHTIEVYSDGSLKIDGNPYP